MNHHPSYLVYAPLNNHHIVIFLVKFLNELYVCFVKNGKKQAGAEQCQVQFKLGPAQLSFHSVWMSKNVSFKNVICVSSYV